MILDMNLDDEQRDVLRETVSECLTRLESKSEQTDDRGVKKVKILRHLVESLQTAPATT